jgi:integrase
LGPELVSGRSRYRSVTVHGSRAVAEAARARWAAKAELVRSTGRSRPGITISRLLIEWLGADHDWKPSTLSGYRSMVRFLAHDRIGVRRAVDLTPKVMVALTAAWRTQGCPEPTVSGRVRVLRSALGWAHVEGILDVFPLDGMHGPPHAGVRLHAPVDQVLAILDCARHDVAELETATGASLPTLHRAEQMLLLARLAADSGARRGELAALQIADLDGEVLTIARAASMEMIGPTKTRQIRRLTLGASAAALWRDTVERWRQRASADQTFGPWLFSARTDHSTRLTTSCLAHWFRALCAEAGHPDVTLHRLRHSVATALVSRGDILQAQYRLGHRDAATTLRTYSHVLPLTDADAAATLDHLYQE